MLFIIFMIFRVTRRRPLIQLIKLMIMFRDIKTDDGYEVAFIFIYLYYNEIFSCNDIVHKLFDVYIVVIILKANICIFRPLF